MIFVDVICTYIIIVPIIRLSENAPEVISESQNFLAPDLPTFGI